MGEPGEALAGAKPPRLRRRLLIIVMVLLVVGLGMSTGIALNNRSIANRNLARANRASSEAAHWKSEAQSWQQSSQMFQKDSEGYQSQLNDLQAKITASVGNLNRPNFTLWNSCSAAGPAAGCPLTPGYEYVGGVPDTFTYYPSFHASVPVTLYIMTSSDFVCRESGNCAYHWVGWEKLTDLNGVFHDAEGCAGYIAVFFSDQAGTLYPDVSITRHPAPNATGACR